MKLFGTPGSPFARKVRIVLEEKGIPHEYVIERPSVPGSRVPQFNPLGKVPTLVLDDGHQHRLASAPHAPSCASTRRGGSSAASSAMPSRPAVTAWCTVTAPQCASRFAP